MIRAFLAIDLPDAVRSALAVQQFLLPLPRKVEPENLHLTLVFLGEVPEPVLTDAHDLFSAIRSDAFSLHLQGLGLFGGNRPRAAWAGVAPSAPLTRLQAKLDHAARSAGCKVDPRRFHPHVTLGSFAPPPPVDAMRLERAIAADIGFRTDPFPVSEVVLYRSTLNPKGARYDPLARYALREGSTPGVPPPDPQSI
ncbi:MAG: RNA 2',3'-cyclic phosphodiesterase [Pseudomonadota bacterium]